MKTHTERFAGDLTIKVSLNNFPRETKNMSREKERARAPQGRRERRIGLPFRSDVHALP